MLGETVTSPGAEPPMPHMINRGGGDKKKQKKTKTRGRCAPPPTVFTLVALMPQTPKLAPGSVRVWVRVWALSPRDEETVCKSECLLSIVHELTHAPIVQKDTIVHSSSTVVYVIVTTLFSFRQWKDRAFLSASRRKQERSGERVSARRRPEFDEFFFDKFDESQVSPRRQLRRGDNWFIPYRYDSSVVNEDLFRGDEARESLRAQFGEGADGADRFFRLVFGRDPDENFLLHFTHLSSLSSHTWWLMTTGLSLPAT